MQLQPLHDIHFNTDYQEYPFRKAHFPTLYGLMGIARFIDIFSYLLPKDKWVEHLIEDEKK